MQIADSHCDLLSYLFYEKGHQYDAAARCSIPQLQQGNVVLQTLAIFTNSADSQSSENGIAQSEIFANLLTEEDEYVFGVQNFDDLEELENDTRIGLIASIENASGFCSEYDNLEDGFDNLETIIRNTGRVFYISLTHHHKNRFGGGNYTRTGLLDDGRRLLDYLSGRNIAIDFSHTSDALAYDILQHIDAEDLDLHILASHSNMRAIHPNKRNLPDELVEEILRRGGIIGLNWIKSFIGRKQEDYFKHLEYALSLGASHQLCMGSDLFYFEQPEDKPNINFFEPYQTAADYPSFIDDLEAHNILNPKQLRDFTKNNLLNFLEKLMR
jgi:microsomal dipeptidase-like Zn-dependent dipeptidase